MFLSITKLYLYKLINIIEYLYSMFIKFLWIFNYVRFWRQESEKGNGFKMLADKRQSISKDRNCFAVPNCTTNWKWLPLQGLRNKLYHRRKESEQGKEWPQDGQVRPLPFRFHFQIGPYLVQWDFLLLPQGQTLGLAFLTASSSNPLKKKLPDK